jgi:fatty acid desaturase
MNPRQREILVIWIKMVTTVVAVAGFLAALFLWDWRYAVGAVVVIVGVGVLIEEIEGPSSDGRGWLCWPAGPRWRW